MRVPVAHVEAMRALIAPADTAGRRAAYRMGDFARSDLVKDLDRRYRWDLFYGTGANRVLWDDDTDGLHDTHIDTALRAIVAPLVCASTAYCAWCRRE